MLKEKYRKTDMSSERRKNISLEQLSEITGLSSIHLSRIEEGRLNIGIDMLSQILNGLDVKIILI